jgi:hypothetical protein
VCELPSFWWGLFAFPSAPLLPTQFLDACGTRRKAGFFSSFGPHLVAKCPPQLLRKISEFCAFYVLVIIMGYSSDVPQHTVS